MQAGKRVGMRTRALAGAVTLVTTAMLALTAPPAAASHYTNTTELSASTNTGVAIAWSKAAFPATATEVLLGRDDLFADSLASGAMQGSRPLLLTNSQTLSADTNTELQRLRPTTVNIMGGTSAVSAAVENDLRGKGYQIRRFSGPTRIETAIDIARRALPTATSAILAAAFAPPNADQTRAFADSIAAGGWAADRNMPVLLTETERLSTATKNYLRGDGALIRTVFVVGGSAAINDAVITELQQLGITARRISGPTRFDTAVRIAQERGDADASQAPEVILTEGQAADSWVAGFSSAAYSAAKDAPIVLSNGTSLPAPTTTWLSPTAKAAATKLACAPRVATEACDAASQAMGHTAVTGTMPRLVSATAGIAANGLRPVSFKFSEPVAAQVTGGNFFLYTYDAQRATPASAAIDPTQPDTVIAQFTDTAFSEYTVAAVATGAVRSATTSLNNPEGSAGLQAYSRSTGQTRGPRLIGVQLVEHSDDDWVVEFDFDRDLAGCGAKNLFVLVEAKVENGETAPPTRVGDGSGAADLEGTRSCAVEFTGMPDIDDDPNDFDDEIGRALALEGSATSMTSHAAVPTSDQVTAGTQAGPVLTSISTSGDVATFTFDKAIDAAIEGAQTTLASKFHVFDSLGRRFDGISATINATGSTTQVNVTFASGELRNVIVSGRVDADAVKTQPTITPPDAGTFNGAGAAFVSGSNTFDRVTHVPPVTAIARTVSGSNASVRYTFSGAVDPSGGAGRFVVYDASAARTELSSCAEDASTAAEDIVCTGNQTTSAAQFNAIRNAVYAGASRDAYRPGGQGGDALEDSLPNPETGRLLS